MEVIYRFLRSYEPLIYIFLALGGVFSFRWLWTSWREWQQSVYRLEREFSLQRLSRAATVSVLIVVLLCAEFLLATFFLPGLPASVFMPTATLDMLVTPSGTLSPETMTQLAAAPAPIVSANTQGCVPNQLIITSPKPGEEVKGTVDIIGTVNIPNFGFYKYEVARRGEETWATIAADTKTKNNQSLGSWITNALTPGDYQLRVVVTDNQGQSLPPCIIPIRVLAP